jgi:hypothetical protein
VVRRLKNAGAVLLGKTNLHEFALGGTSAVSYFGPVHNPWALDRIPGGSSGGSGAATAAGLCFGSLGTDTAGSVRMLIDFGFDPSTSVSNMKIKAPQKFTDSNLAAELKETCLFVLAQMEMALAAVAAENN